MTQATQATLTEEEMIDNLYIMAEELQLQAMAVNRRRLAQVHAGLHGHTHHIDFRLYPSDVEWIGEPYPEELSKLDLRLDLNDGLWLEANAELYQEAMDKALAFSQQLDQILDHNRPLVAR